MEEYKLKIQKFLITTLRLELHPEKSRIVNTMRGVEFLGMRIFPYHKLLKRKNIGKFRRKSEMLCAMFDQREAEYDTIYDFLEGWIAYTKNANAYNLRRRVMKEIEPKFIAEVSTKEYNRYLAARGGKRMAKLQ